jgi:4-hydroxybenzoyl-CoA reductase alpha subunit
MSTAVALTELKKELSVVGKELPRIDGMAKVRGTALYACNVNLPNMLWAKILRSPYAHAKIKRIDVTKAERLPGVVAVITSKDIPDIKLGFDPELYDKPPLATDKVRYVGDEVAAVAAIDEETAEKAIQLIEVEYERLPVVLDVEEAIKKNAPRLHDEAELNIAKRFHSEFGNVEQGFKEADYIFEDRFVTPQQAHVALETHGCIAMWDADNAITMWVATQVPHTYKKDLARILNVPESKISIKKVYVGGGFGGRSEVFSYEIIALFLSKKTGRPIKLILSREEEFLGTVTRHPMVIELKTGVKKDGTITTRYVKLLVDTGAYASQGPLVTASAAWKAGHYYRISNYKYDAYCIYTNKPICSAYRTFGGVQITFAIESQMDIIAEKLGIDPVELRLRNANQSGDITITGSEFVTCGLKECITKAVEAINWYEKKKAKRPFRGLGVSCAFLECGFRGFIGNTDTSAAFVKVNSDGSVEVLTGGTDLGTGLETAMAKIAAEVLGVRYEDVKIISQDTDATPFDVGEVASRGTHFCGNAVMAAALDAKKKIFEVAAKLLQCSPLDLESKGGMIYLKENPNKAISFSEVARHIQLILEGVPILGKGYYAPETSLPDEKGKYKPPGPCPVYIFSAMTIEVEVDPETGEVKLIEAACATDCGRAINPSGVEGQIEGGIQHGLGLALIEGLVFDENGEPLNANLMDYKILTTADMPKIKPIIIETLDPRGPFGAKGAAQTETAVAAAAVANAIYDATGIRIKEAPITPEKILHELKKKGK